ncbi:hypothetical protein G7054_g3821 [Neopestalotiopsis clavispora]|nr:hypothetical protein G7054_g3821 [Neopestalotiopsis clavispora]
MYPSRSNSDMKEATEEPLTSVVMSSTTASSQKSQFVRPKIASVGTMKFWDCILAPAMEDFEQRNPSEPKGRGTTEFSIRGLRQWDDIHIRLRNAQEAYEQLKGVRGNLVKGLRKVAEHADLAQQAVSLVPNIDYLSPVVGALKIIANAARASNEIRQNVVNSLEEAEHNLGDVEEYLMLFPEDENIKRASVKLVSFTLKAIEDVIGYFIKNKVVKAVTAIVSGQDYQKSLTECFAQIKACSIDLVHQARNSNMWQNKSSESGYTVLKTTQTYG